MTIHATIHTHTQCTRVRAILRAVTQEIKMKRKCVWCFFRCGDITPQHFDVWRLSLDFFQRGLSLWFLDNLYYYYFFFFFRFLVFAQNRPQNNDDDVLEWWKGQKKITVYNLGTFYLRVWAEPSHRFDEKQSNGNFFNKFACKVSEQEEGEWSNDVIPPGNKKLKIAKNTE